MTVREGMDFWVSRDHFDRFASEKLGPAVGRGRGSLPPMFGSSRCTTSSLVDLERPT